MQVIKQKVISSYVPEFVRVGLGLILCLMYDGRVYDDFPGRCVKCGSGNFEKVGTRRVLFAKLVVKDGFADVMVHLQRYHCKDCDDWYTSHGPFYDGALYGSPIFDLALMLSMENSSYGVERNLLNLGIQLGSDAILGYNRLLADKSREYAPLVKDGGGSLYGINLLKVLFGVDDVKGLAEKLPDADLRQSLADEAYLRKKGALKKFIDEVMNAESRRIVHRGLKNKDVVIKDGKPSFPDSFTLALSYIPGAEAYASLICTPQPFNQLLAEILFKALAGSPLKITDGSRNYDGLRDMRCTLHKTRNELKNDPKFKELKNEAREAQKRVKEAKSEEEKKRAIEDRARRFDEIKEHAKAKYQEVVK